jgi:hypothetical protein
MGSGGDVVIEKFFDQGQEGAIFGHRWSPVQ